MTKTSYIRIGFFDFIQQQIIAVVVIILKTKYFPLMSQYVNCSSYAFFRVWIRVYWIFVWILL